MKKLVVFDVDGVLLDNETGGFKDILRLLGKKEGVRRIDEEYQKRKHLGPWGLEELARFYKGFRREELKAAARKYCRDNFMPGARKTIAAIQEKGGLAGAISSNPQFLMDALAEILSLDFAYGTKLEFKKGVATGKITFKVDRYVKAEILKEKMEELNLKKEETAAVGDSLTDLPMAERAGFFIGFNAKKEIEKRADVIIIKKDLGEVLKSLS